LGTIAKGASSNLSIALLGASNRMRVQVQRGLNGRVSRLLLRDLGGYADVVQDGSVHVAKFMPRFEEIRTMSARRLRMRPRERDFPHRFSALGLLSPGSTVVFFMGAYRR